jgi:hypothetical protein
MQKEWSTPMQSTNARIEVFMEMKIKVEVFLVVMPCSVAVGYLEQASATFLLDYTYLNPSYI